MSDKLEQIAYEVDNYIAALAIKYEVDPLSLTAIILGRLVMTNDYAGSGDDFRKLLSVIPPKARIMDSAGIVH
jgi:hypothetical protein